MTVPIGAAPRQEKGPPVAEVVELRVHGVHGTSPSSMLGLTDADVAQVAGDGLTGVFRPRAGAELPTRTLTDTTSVEAYSWGALASAAKGVLGWVKRALWRLLCPPAVRYPPRRQAPGLPSTPARKTRMRS